MRVHANRECWWEGRERPSNPTAIARGRATAMDLNPPLRTLFSDHTQVRVSGGRTPEQGCSNHISEMALGMEDGEDKEGECIRDLERRDEAKQSALTCFSPKTHHSAPTGVLPWFSGNNICIQHPNTTDLVLSFILKT